VTWILGVAGVSVLVLGVLSTGGGALQLASMVGVGLVAGGVASAFGELRARGAGAAAAEAELHRAVDGLHALAENANTLPGVARSLERTETGLGELRAEWTKLQEESARDLSSVLRETVHALRSDMKVAVEDAGFATRQAIEPLVADGVERTARAASERLDTLLEAFSRELDARRESEKRLAEALDVRLQSLVESQNASLTDSRAAFAEAASAVRAGSAELGAFAQMFAESVDRHRDAASAWLDGLSRVDDAVLRAGEGAAADALRGQLAATEELFARQLGFQQALFEQVRALRGGSLDEDSSVASVAGGTADESHGLDESA